MADKKYENLREILADAVTGAIDLHTAEQCISELRFKQVADEYQAQPLTFYAPEYKPTQREYFAARAIEINEDGISHFILEDLMGSKRPIGSLDKMMWEFSVRSKLKLMYVDALITELNKPDNATS